jgi:hypothetical protein
VLEAVPDSAVLIMFAFSFFKASEEARLADLRILLDVHRRAVRRDVLLPAPAGR